ncbi:hypothetical protein [Rhodovulum sulfidophilum]|uniref:hypothetical protein n=1 Tax=Rhodovulum sulfidophilum TaxID=35806 RepID=UPI001F193289|nr:hypothetical protein [Rhodovulum sulfidophilum]
MSWITTKAVPDSAGQFSKRVSRADDPPADAPIPIIAAASFGGEPKGHERGSVSVSIRNACPAFFKPAHAVDHVYEALRSILSSVLAYDQGLINLFPRQAFPAPRHGFLQGALAPGAQSQGLFSRF